MYRWLLLLLVLIKLSRLSKLYKITIHVICTITTKQQLIAIYYLITLYWYYTTFWNSLGTLWVWLCQLAVSAICVEAGFSEQLPLQLNPGGLLQTPPNLVTQNTTIQLLGALNLLNKGKPTICKFIGVQKVHQHLKTAQFNLNSVIDRNTSSNKTIFLK